MAFWCQHDKDEGMGPFELSSRWKALKLHFSRWDYDYFKFNGHVKNHDNVKHHWAFERLARRCDPVEFMVTAILEKRGEHISEAVRDSDLDGLHLQRRGRVESLSWVVEQELKWLDLENFNQNFVGDPPPILYHFWGKRISRETASVLVALTNASVGWGKKNDWMVKQSAIELVKYFPFLECDQTKIAGIIVRRCLQAHK